MATSIMRQPRARRSRKAAGATDPIQQLLEHRAGIIARQEFMPIGRVMQIYTHAGIIDFRNRGPAIGKLNDGDEQTLDLVEAWPGAPSRFDTTQENCPYCLTKCDECKRGVRKCNHGPASCGGAGKRKTGEKPCRCVRTRKRPNPSCKTCYGAGSLVVMGKCEICKGRGKVKCPLCKGTAKMSTGKLNGSQERTAPNCPHCQGYGRKLMEIEQPIAPHVKEHGGMFVLGPIRGMLVMPLVGDKRMPQWWSASVDTKGRSLTLILRHTAPGAQAAMLGGTIIVHNSTGQA